MKSNRKLTTEIFKSNAVEVHGERFIYDFVEVGKNNKVKVTIVCKVHGEFTASPNNHLRSKNGGCTKCKNQKSYNPWSYSDWEKQGAKSKDFNGFKLYLVKLWDDDSCEVFYKIGKTFRPFHQRFGPVSNVPYEYHVIDYIEGSAKFISELENKVHQRLKHKKYSPLISFRGDKECFTLSGKELVSVRPLQILTRV